MLRGNLHSLDYDEKKLDDLTVKCIDMRAVCKRLEARFKTLVNKRKEQSI